MGVETGFVPIEMGSNIKGTAAIYNAPSSKTLITKIPTVLDMILSGNITPPNEVVDTPTALASGSTNKVGTYLIIGVVIIAAVFLFRRIL